MLNSKHLINTSCSPWSVTLFPHLHQGNPVSQLFSNDEPGSYITTTWTFFRNYSPEQSSLSHLLPQILPLSSCTGILLGVVKENNFPDDPTNIWSYPLPAQPAKHLCFMVSWFPWHGVGPRRQWVWSHMVGTWFQRLQEAQGTFKHWAE